jgi:hypothetical protein
MSRSLTIADLKEPREAAFVAAVFELGGPQYGAEAAMRAGYTADPNEAPRIAAILLGSSRIAKAIAGEVKARFDVAASAAFNTILEIAADRKAPASARLAAAQAIIDRSSIGPIPSRSVSLTGNGSIEELLTLLDGNESESGEVIEAEFSDVAPEGGR